MAIIVPIATILFIIVSTTMLGSMVIDAVSKRGQ